MNYLIIEDEPLAADKIITAVSEIRPQWTNLSVLPSIRKSVSDIPDLNPDLIFLDVHLGDGISFKIFEELNLNIPIIFTTAYDKYAIKAFELNSIDYLLKPVSKADLLRAIEKFEGLTTIHKPSFDWNQLLQDLKPQFKERFMVSTGKRIKSLNTADIAFFYAHGKNTFITDKDGTEYLIDKTLGSLGEQLNPKYFFHINRQYIVRIDSISEMISYSKGRLKINTSPSTPTEAIVSVDKAPRSKMWLEGET